MSAHTPGPWEVKAAEAEATYLRVRGTRLGARYKVANILAPVPLGENPIEAAESHANARLIAAAPELLEALQLVASGLARGTVKAQAIAIGGANDAQMRITSLAQIVGDAIAKAEGA